MSLAHYFVTGTGTDVGKTMVTSGLVRLARQRSRAVTAIKPVATGVDTDNILVSDPARLAEAMGLAVVPHILDRICPWTFKLPLSPHMAAAAEGRPIYFEEVVAFCAGAMAKEGGAVLIEGIGGAMVPLNREHTVLDLIEALSLPIVLVCGSYLGTISHTLATIAAIRQRGVTIAATVISESTETAGTLGELADTIRDFAATDPICIPRTAEGAPAPLMLDPLYEQLWA